MKISRKHLRQILEASKDSGKSTMSESLRYHADRGVGVDQNIFRPGSEEFFELFREARALYTLGLYTLNEPEWDLIADSDIGEFSYYEGKRVPLDYPMLYEELLIRGLVEAKYKSGGREIDVKLGKAGAQRIGGGKARVYVRDPKTKKVKKVEFGSSMGKAMGKSEKAKKRRKSFGDRHNCSDKKDKTKPGYWSCRLTKLFGRSISGWW